MATNVNTFTVVRNARIRKLAARGISFTVIAHRYGVTRQRIEQIVHWERQRARRQATKAKAAGRIAVATRCQACGDNGSLEAHHDDYSRPLSVRWLCRPCHRAADWELHGPRRMVKINQNRKLKMGGRCPNGHPLEDWNVRIYNEGRFGDGGVRCLECCALRVADHLDSRNGHRATQFEVKEMLADLGWAITAFRQNTITAYKQDIQITVSAGRDYPWVVRAEGGHVWGRGRDVRALRSVLGRKAASAA